MVDASRSLSFIHFRSGRQQRIERYPGTHRDFSLCDHDRCILPTNSNGCVARPRDCLEGIFYKIKVLISSEIQARGDTTRTDLI